MEKSVYMQLKEKASPFIKSYRDDLVKHDREFLRKNPGVPFLHFTGESGTHLYAMWPSEKLPGKGEVVKYLFGYSTREEIIESEFSVIPSMKTRYGRGDMAMYFDGQKLQEISYDKATRIAEKYIKSVKGNGNGRN